MVQAKLAHASTLIRIPLALKREAKKAAIDQGITMEEYIVEALKRAVEEGR